HISSCTRSAPWLRPCCKLAWSLNGSTNTRKAPGACSPAKRKALTACSAGRTSLGCRSPIPCARGSDRAAIGERHADCDAARAKVRLSRRAGGMRVVVIGRRRRRRRIVLEPLRNGQAVMIVELGEPLRIGREPRQWQGAQPLLDRCRRREGLTGDRSRAI